MMLAKDLDVSLVGLHAMEPDVPPSVLADPMVGYDVGPALAIQHEQIEAERDAAVESFEEMAAECGRRGFDFSSRIVAGFLVQVLSDEANATDLIVVGRKGRFAKSGFGSSTRALIEKSPCAVLVVSGTMRPLVRALAVYDSSAESKRAVAFAEDLAERAGWPLTILAAKGHGHSLDEALHRAQEMAPEATVISLSEEEQSDEGQLIEHAASKNGYALLVMGAYADSWLHRLFFGGTTEHVLESVGAPVVLVH
jgi:nucleotide-binding universal stress UspA family protein